MKSRYYVGPIDEKHVTDQAMALRCMAAYVSRKKQAFSARFSWCQHEFDHDPICPALLGASMDGS
jgi:hypothetical protein